MARICTPCQSARDAEISVHPQHLVHPEHRKPHVFDVYGEAICPGCGALWRRLTNNTVVLVAP